jgi:hypothetical protein
MAIGALVGVARAVAKPLAKAVGKQVLGDAAEGVGKAGMKFLEKGGKEGLESAFNLFKKGGKEVLEKGGEGATKLLKDVFGEIAKKGGKEALQELLENGGAKLAGGQIAKAMSKSAFGFEIPGLDKLGGKALEKLVGGALGGGKEGL